MDDVTTHLADHASWTDFAERVGLPAPRRDEEYAALTAAYGEPHRHYHTLEHVASCLVLLSELATSKTEVEAALWYHDAVYDAKSSRNEEKSADWAVASLRGTDLSEEQLARIRDLILATRHGDPPAPGDPTLIVDVDLAILGAPPDEYQRYEVAIRKEYRWVPGFLFRKKRREILQSFLDRPAIYGTEEFRKRFEAPARRNLEQAIAALR
jgi:predicted metal-dependent HD superfamily phosphohydrolase